jgi:hypothetical protein
LWLIPKATSLLRAVKKGDGSTSTPIITPAILAAGCHSRTEVLLWFDQRKQELANRPLVREQASGNRLIQTSLDRLGRYEVHLDRKLERTPSMLLKLRSCDPGRPGPDPFGKMGGTRADFR